MAFFTKLEQKFKKAVQKHKRPQTGKTILRTKNGEGDIMLPDYTTKLQSSKQYGTGIKTDTQINGTGQKAQK